MIIVRGRQAAGAGWWAGHGGWMPGRRRAGNAPCADLPAAAWHPCPQPHLDALKKYTYGKHIVTKAEAMLTAQAAAEEAAAAAAAAAAARQEPEQPPEGQQEGGAGVAAQLPLPVPLPPAERAGAELAA